MGPNRRNWLGSSVSYEETIPGIASVGAPILARAGGVAGAVSVSGLTSTMIGERTDLLAEAVREAGREISAAMGYVGAYPPELS